MSTYIILSNSTWDEDWGTGYDRVVNEHRKPEYYPPHVPLWFGDVRRLKQCSLKTGYGTNWWGASDFFHTRVYRDGWGVDTLSCPLGVMFVTSERPDGYDPCLWSIRLHTLWYTRDAYDGRPVLNFRAFTVCPSADGLNRGTDAFGKYHHPEAAWAEAQRIRDWLYQPVNQVAGARTLGFTPVFADREEDEDEYRSAIEADRLQHEGDGDVARDLDLG